MAEEEDRAASVAVEDAAEGDEATVTSLRRAVTLPYDRASLQWDAGRFANAQGVYCYCGRNRDLASGRPEFSCGACGNWFHADCLQCDTSHLMPFMLNYGFTCALCDTDGVERLSLFTASWRDAITTALANLMTLHGGTHFAKDAICQFLDSHWDAVCRGRGRTPTWQATVGSTLYSCSDAFEAKGVRSTAAVYALRTERAQLRPSPQAAARASAAKRKADTAPATVAVGSGAKRARRTAAFQSGGEQPSRTFGSTDYPINRPQYLYFPAEEDPSVPLRVREALPHETAVVLSRSDRAAQLRLSDDLLTVFSEPEKGYCTVRATQGVTAGTFYWEAVVRTPSDFPKAHVRIGWAQRHANLQTPVGYDVYGYSYRDAPATCFHQSKGRAYGRTYGHGDVVGVLIHLPPSNGPSFDHLPPAHEPGIRVPFTFKTRWFIQETLPARRPPSTCVGSFVEFFVNGVSQGVAFTDLSQGTYFPAVSLFKGAAVQVNFGPAFAFPPPDRDGLLPMAEAGVRGFASVVLEDIVARVVDAESPAQSTATAGDAA